MKSYFSHKITRNVFRVFLYLFACVGLIFVSVFIAMRFHLTDVKGSIDSRNAAFTKVSQNASALTSLLGAPVSTGASQSLDAVTACQITTIASILPNNGKMILDAYTSTKSPHVAQKMIQAILLVTTSNTFLQDKVEKCTTVKDTTTINLRTPSNQTIFDWAMSSEWEALRDALIKDKETIAQASRVSGVSERTIVSSVIAEQFRFFTANRESFKRYFEPLKILGNGTKFSYGVAGVKIETAQQIEQNLKNPRSQFYIGPDYEHILDYTTADPDSERLDRLTDTKNHYYSYLYTGLFLKQIMTSWDQAGYPISDRPEVLATLFNLGFVKSVPKPQPEVGGSTITINDRDHTFGGLAYEFYYSGELSDIFPLEVQ